MSCSSQQNSTLKGGWHLPRDNSELVFPSVNLVAKASRTWAKDAAFGITCSAKATKPRSFAKCSPAHTHPPLKHTHTPLAYSYHNDPRNEDQPMAARGHRTSQTWTRIPAVNPAKPSGSSLQKGHTATPGSPTLLWGSGFAVVPVTHWVPPPVLLPRLPPAPLAPQQRKAVAGGTQVTSTRHPAARSRRTALPNGEEPGRESFPWPRKRRIRSGPEADVSNSDTVPRPLELMANGGDETHRPLRTHNGKGHNRSSHKLLREQRRLRSLRLGARGGGSCYQRRLLCGGDS